MPASGTGDAGIRGAEVPIIAIDQSSRAAAVGAADVAGRTQAAVRARAGKELMGAPDRRVARVDGAGVAVAAVDVGVVTARCPITKIEGAGVAVIAALGGAALTLSCRKDALIRGGAGVSVALRGAEHRVEAASSRTVRYAFANEVLAGRIEGTEVVVGRVDAGPGAWVATVHGADDIVVAELKTPAGAIAVEAQLVGRAGIPVVAGAAEKTSLARPRARIA